MVWDPKCGAVANESEKIKWEVVKYTRGLGLDLGCGMKKPFPHFLGVDNCEDFGDNTVASIRVPTVEDLSLFATEQQDFVFSSHCLEHISNYKAALKEWFRVIKIDGYLVLYLPDEDQYPKVGEVGACVGHKWNVNYDRVVDAMKESGYGWDLVKFEKRDQGDEYSLFFVFQKKSEEDYKFSWKEYKKPEKTACVVRYGGIGDVLQTSSVFAALKKQGYHVTFMTIPNGWALTREDPNIDEWVVQDTDQVPNLELYEYWNYVSKQYDKWVNLSGSVEATLLVTKGAPVQMWPHKLRDKFLDHNYGDIMHKIADVPTDVFSLSAKRMYLAQEEIEAATKIRNHIGGKKLVGMVLNGSSFHKTWYHMDAFIARILHDYHDWKVVTFGGKEGVILEGGWDKEDRVVKLANKLTLRESMALASQCDILVGPETGIMNAFAMDRKIAKIILLSHSSHNNLTKYWKNTKVLLPNNVGCYPCHMMHYSKDTCNEAIVMHEDGKLHPTATASCSFSITVDQAWSALKGVVKEWRQAA